MLRLKVGAKDEKPPETGDRTGVTILKRKSSAVSNTQKKARQMRTKNRPFPLAMRNVRVFFARWEQNRMMVSEKMGGNEK